MLRRIPTSGRFFYLFCAIPRLQRSFTHFTLHFLARTPHCIRTSSHFVSLPRSGLRSAVSAAHHTPLGSRRCTTSRRFAAAPHLCTPKDLVYHHRTYWTPHIRFFSLDVLRRTSHTLHTLHTHAVLRRTRDFAPQTLPFTPHRTRLPGLRGLRLPAGFIYRSLPLTTTTDFIPAARFTATTPLRFPSTARSPAFTHYARPTHTPHRQDGFSAFGSQTHLPLFWTQFCVHFLRLFHGRHAFLVYCMPFHCTTGLATAFHRPMPSMPAFHTWTTLLRLAQDLADTFPSCAQFGTRPSTCAAAGRFLPALRMRTPSCWTRTRRCCVPYPAPGCGYHFNVRLRLTPFAILLPGSTCCRTLACAPPPLRLRTPFAVLFCR